MNVPHRIDAAKSKLQAGRDIARAAARAGRPCTECTWFVSKGRLCGHLAYSEQHFNPVNGELRATIQVPAEQARKDDGLCGFEGDLFEPRGYELARRHLPKLGFYFAVTNIWLATGFVFWAFFWPVIVG